MYCYRSGEKGQLVFWVDVWAFGEEEDYRLELLECCYSNTLLLSGLHFPGFKFSAAKHVR